MVRSFGTIAARLAFVVGLGWGVLGFVAADLVLAVVLLVGLGPAWARMTRWRFRPALARELFVVGFPRVPHGALHQVTAMADRFLLAWFLPLDALGRYSVAATIASTLKLYPVALTTAWTPLAFEAMRRPDAPVFYARTATYAYTVMAALATSLVLVADPAIRLLTPEAYHGAAALVPLLVVGVTIQAAANFMSTALQIAKRISPFAVIALVGAIASVAANLAFIPPLGEQGAALASAGAQLALFVATWWFVRTAYPIPYERGRLARTTLVALVAGGAGVAVRAAAPRGVADAASLLLLAAFPLGLIVARVFRPTEVARLRRWIGDLARAPGPPASGPRLES
jgi:O-antigen/teichoic acid export membrane protein